jgi:hypothetical protein
MRGKSQRNRIRRRDSITNWTVTFVAAALTFALLVATDRRGLPRKWVTAIIGTLGPFSLVLYAFRRHLLRWSFWVALSLCLAAHAAVVWVFFQYVLIEFQNVSIWLCLPVMCLETILPLIAVKRLEEKFTGQSGTMRLDF